MTQRNCDMIEGITRDEDRLLIACARPRHEGEMESHVSDLLDRELDWAHVISAAIRHGVLPLLYRSCTPLDLSSCPMTYGCNCKDFFSHFGTQPFS